MILFRQKYPRWWFDWNLELLRFSNRIGVYLALMDDRYPSTDEQQAVALDFPYPDAKQGLNRWLPLVKWLLAIPHYIVLVFLWIAAVVVGGHRLVRDPLHRPLPARPLRLRPRRLPLDEPRRRLRVHPGHRRIPAIPTQPLKRGRAGPARPISTTRPRAVLPRCHFVGMIGPAQLKLRFREHSRTLAQATRGLDGAEVR